MVYCSWLCVQFFLGLRFSFLGVQASVFSVNYFGARFQCSGIHVQGFPFTVRSVWFIVHGSGFIVHGLLFRVQGSAFRF